jgi:Ca-activated chloride channel family protein
MTKPQNQIPTLNAKTDRRLIRADGRSKRFVLVQVTAPPANRRTERLPVNLAFVLDRSGSMSGEKIELARRTIIEAIGRLDPRDRFSIVTYDDVVDVIVEATPATPEARSLAVGRLGSVDARNSTNLSGGWLRGAEQVAAGLMDQGVNRVLLLTDGLANAGITNADELATHAGALRKRGVSTTTFGLGADFDEVLLQGMADAGGGHFYFVRDAATIRDHISSEVGETLEVVARDVELDVVVADGVRVEPISPQPVRARGGRTLVDLGDLVADQVLDVVLRVTFPFGDEGRTTGAIIGLGDRDGAFASARPDSMPDARVSWTWADHAANEGQPREVEVDRAVATQFAARARQEAVKLNREHDYAGARHILEATAKRIRGYAGRDARMREIVAELSAEAERFAAPMPSMMLKEAHFASSTLARMRSASGQALKSRTPS